MKDRPRLLGLRRPELVYSAPPTKGAARNVLTDQEFGALCRAIAYDLGRGRAFDIRLQELMDGEIAEPAKPRVVKPPVAKLRVIEGGAAR